MVDEHELAGIEGLSDEEAARRLKQEGPNSLPSGKKRTVLRIAFDILKEPMFLLLVGAGIVYLVLGDLQEALILMSFVIMVMGITFYQEQRTERALEALRDLSSPRALVIRGSRQVRIAGVEVVRGDILILAEGDRVPADAVLLVCSNLTVDESLLTGESVPVRKLPCEGPLELGKPGGDDQPSVFAGTLVVKGHGVARVEATGAATEMGKIGTALEAIEPEPTLLQRETRRVVLGIALLALFLCVLVFVVYGATHADWLDGLLVGITLAMAMLPEEFPVVLVIFLTLGAWRISRNHVLTRDMPAVETLGSATVLCVDKTGTLTLNRMSVAKLMACGVACDLRDADSRRLPEEFHELVEFSVLASQRDPFDPVEMAIAKLGDRALYNTEHLHDDWLLEREYPLSPELLALSHVWSSPDGREYIIAAKGAPEAVADLCHLDDARKEELWWYIDELASEGLRILGVARASFTMGDLPTDQHDFVFEFLGLVGLEDPVRPAVKESVRECYGAGIRVIMITGDYPGTARHIAREIGLEPEDEFITGPELDGMGDAELRERIGSVNIFARVVPEQKLRIVKALKANGEVVAMTGDGVNDAPALKAANIGVAMGGRGTDVARESASLVLLDDDFSSIETAVKMGRRIYDNLKKAMSYVIAIHVPIAGMSIIPVLFKLPLVFSPMLIAFLEIIIDPACSLVFEAEPAEGDIMQRPPRRPDQRIFNRRNVVISLLQGLSVLFIVAAVFSFAHMKGMDEMEIRALTFTTLVIANLGLILTNRSWEHTIWHVRRQPNPALWWIVGGTLVLLTFVLYAPFMREIFGFAFLGGVDIAICLGAGLLSVMWFEALKFFTHRKYHPHT
ncbi:MAG: cation-translocating P-type ATPase [Actinobacteria bacterium]|jgi:Ca2+-transporting ATPase|nr:MAG: cation-translocating P-type ATPase [Actinomycetota bacterium]